MFDRKKYGFLFRDTEVIPGIDPLEVVMLQGNELAEQRKALGLTQQQVANRAGINIRQYQRLETNERSLASTSFRIGLNICCALKINPMYYCEVRE